MDEIPGIQQQQEAGLEPGWGGQTMAADLSLTHEMVGQTFASGQDEKVNCFSTTELESFATYGFLKGGRVLDDSQLATLRSELEALSAPAETGSEFWYEYHSNESTKEDQVLFHALGAWRIAPGFHDLLWHRPWLAKASQLLGAAVRFWHDQLFCKPARHGGSVAWHQDFSYWTRTTPMAHLTCWIALDDATVENGCLHYVPGSHAWNLLPITGLAGGMEAIEEVLSREQREGFQRAMPVELAAGECVFHHPLAIHGSFANDSARARRATVVNVFADGVKSASNEPLLNGVSVIPTGEKMDGQFFPLLFDPETAGE